MAIPATQLRPGMIIKHNDNLHLVFKVEHRTPGNLRAFIQAKLRNLKSGAMFEHRFRSADAIEKVVVDEIQMEFLYSDGDDYYFMNPVDYEQTVLKTDTLGDAVEIPYSQSPDSGELSRRASGRHRTSDLRGTNRSGDRAGPEIGHSIVSNQARQDRDRPCGAGAALHQ